MANTAQAKKRVRQAVTRRARNVGQRARVRTVIKQVLIAVESEDKTEAQKAFREAVSVIDRMTDKGILHRNTAARHKSRLNTHLRSMG